MTLEQITVELFFFYYLNWIGNGEYKKKEKKKKAFVRKGGREKEQWYHYSKYKFIWNKRLSFHSICHLKQDYQFYNTLQMSMCTSNFHINIHFHIVSIQQQIGHRFDFHIYNFLVNDSMLLSLHMCVTLYHWVTDTCHCVCDMRILFIMSGS